MLKILQAKLQQYMIQELQDVQAVFRKGRGTRDQIANIRWIIKKAREFQKKTCTSFFLYDLHSINDELYSLLLFLTVLNQQCKK